MTNHRRAVPAALLAAGLCAALLASPALGQQQAPAGKGKLYYDEYEPSRTRQLRSQACLRNEESIRGFCVRSCQRGYVMVPERNPPRCRSVQPLPPGQLPGPLRRETGSLPKLPKPDKPTPPPAGAY